MTKISVNKREYIKWLWADSPSLCGSLWQCANGQSCSEQTKITCYIKDKEGLSPLHTAARNGCVEVVKTLIAETKGYPYKICELLDKNDRTALHVAVVSRKWCVVRMTLKMKEFNDVINKKDKEGNTCLHLASLHRDFWILIMLAGDTRVEKGALNKIGMAAIDICRSSV